MADHHQRGQELFHAALELGSSGERQAFLKGACGPTLSLWQAVGTLIEAHAAAEGFIPTRQADTATARGESTPSEEPGNVLGRYKLLQKIGEGGCRCRK